MVGLISLVVLAGLIALSLAMFQRSFTSTRSLTVKAPRAGLMMGAGGDVKLRGVDVGTVRSVDSTPTGALLTLAIDTKAMGSIPANVTARIVPTTLFGNKYVELRLPGAPGPAITPGAVIAAQHVTVEVNDTFSQLMKVLGAVKPRDVNGALSALAGSLRGNGRLVGEFIALLDRYLADINPALPTLDVDLAKGATVADEYAGLAPDLVRVLGNGGTLSDTIVANKASLHAMLLSFTSLADHTSSLVTNNAAGLDSVLSNLDPTTKLLAEYAPELPCVVNGLVVSYRYGMRIFGGEVPGIYGVAGLLPAQDGYKNPRDLPVVAAKAAPACYGLPNLSLKTLQHPAFDDGGPDPYAGDTVLGGSAGTAGGMNKVYGKQVLLNALGIGNIL